MIVRPFQEGEEPALFEVFHSAIHMVAKRDYSFEQLNAWAPPDLDSQVWLRRIRGISPFVAELHGQLVGYADLQPNGYIDHFFVSGLYQRRGIGTALMEKLLDKAYAAKAKELTSDVSRTAQPFFEYFGFEVVEYKTPVIRNVTVPNASMLRVLPI